MIGKKNIVFGFFYLVLTAALGPYMILQYYGDVATSEVIKQEKVGALQQARDSGYEADLEKMNAEQIAKASVEALLALSARLNSRSPIEEIKGGPHSHGNLEALLNIAVGLVLCFIAAPALLKQAVSWLLIAGALSHSGLLYLATGLQLPWAGALLGGWFGYVGPILVLAGLALAGIAALIGFNRSTVKDN